VTFETRTIDFTYRIFIYVDGTPYRGLEIDLRAFDTEHDAREYAWDHAFFIADHIAADTVAPLHKPE
jgi:hypothetical protein